MSELSSRLELPFLMPSQAQKHVTHNEALQRLDMLVHLSVTSFSASAPPADPEAGEVHAVGAVPSGAWSGHANRLAAWTGSGWIFVTPLDGWLAWDLGASILRVHEAGAWVVFAPLPEQVSQLGIGASADAVNRFAVASDAVLFSHAGDDQRLTINKAGDGDTASLVFQSDWTGHAEMGLAGDTAFALRASADGGTWITMLKADPAAEAITLSPGGTVRATLADAAFEVNVPITGAAVQAAPEDATEGRLMKTGAFGIGGLSLNYDGDLDILDNSTAPGFYHFSSTGVGGTPPRTPGWFHMLHRRRAYGGGEVQIAVQDNSADMFVRSRVTGNWLDWAMQYSQQNAVGDVSMDNAVPSGALIETGTGANGSYMRLADGTQICWITALGAPGLTGAGPIYQSAPVTWTFPAAFRTGTEPAVTGQGRALGRWVSSGTADSVSVEMSVLGTGASGGGVTIGAMAIGRWS